MNQKTCKDCIHYDVCLLERDNNKDKLTADGLFKKAEEDCAYFKDKSRIVELPCKVGDKVFYIYSETDGEKVIGGPDEIIEVGSKGYWMSSVVNEKNMDIFTPYTELGKTEFLTREEAEIALERMKNENGKC